MNKKGCLNTSLFIRTGYFVLDEMTDEVVDLAAQSPVPDHQKVHLRMEPPKVLLEVELSPPRVAAGVCLWAIP